MEHNLGSEQQALPELLRPVAACDHAYLELRTPLARVEVLTQRVYRMRRRCVLLDAASKDALNWFRFF